MMYKNHMVSIDTFAEDKELEFRLFMQKIRKNLL